MRIGAAVATLLFAGLAACDERPGNPRAAELPLRDSVDSVLRRPRVVQAAAVVVFWLPASDTLHPDDAAAAYEELTLATERIVRPLATYEIQLLPTHADTLYIELPNHRRHTVVLAGLEFPFGFVLIEPGSDERVLSGLYGEAELLDEIRVYFDLPEDSTGTPARVTTE